MVIFGEIQSAYSEGQSPEGDLGEASLLQDAHHLLSLWKSFDGGCEIAVCALVFRDNAAVNRQKGVRIELEALLHGEVYGLGKLSDAQMTTFLQYPAHLAQSLIQILEVSDAKGRCDCIESVVGK